jgi:hypothetical protein
MVLCYERGAQGMPNESLPPGASPRVGMFVGTLRAIAITRIR